MNSSTSPAIGGGILLSVVVPCYNEEDAIPLFYDALSTALRGKQERIEQYEVIFVDDGSSDTSLKEIKVLCQKDSRVGYASFSRNFGKEAAMYAGFKKARGEYVALMDVDLQDPPALLAQMVAFLVNNKDYDLTGCRRVDRKGRRL